MYNTFQERLRSARKRKGMTLQQMGEMCGIHFTLLSQYETGKKTPRLDTAIELANFLGISLDYLAGRTKADEAGEKALLKMGGELGGIPPAPRKLDGKALADRLCLELKARCNTLRANGIQPRLTIVTDARDPVSAVYIRNKLRRCEEIGIVPDVRQVDRLTRYNLREICAARQPVILQMPMEWDTDVTPEILSQYVGPACDAGGFLNAENVAALAAGWEPVNDPCTPKGIIRLLDAYQIPLAGAGVCVIGRSNLVGRPLARMLEHRGAAVTLCHSRTPAAVLAKAIAASEIVVSATGNRAVLRDWAGHPEKILVDVGMNREETGRLYSDFSRQAVENCRAYTPVPGGVGPMTVAMLMENVILFYEREAQYDKRGAASAAVPGAEPAV